MRRPEKGLYRNHAPGHPYPDSGSPAGVHELYGRLWHPGPDWRGIPCYAHPGILRVRGRDRRFRQLCGMYGDHYGGSHRNCVPAAEMVCEYQVLYHELHEADSAQGGPWNQRLFHSPVYLSAGSHLHHTPVLPRHQDAGVCGWIFPGKLPQGVLHSHPVHQEYISLLPGSYCDYRGPGHAHRVPGSEAQELADQRH